MVGSVLFPLNELEHHYPVAWRRERAKYEGREAVLDVEVPPLGCRWNDVLHLSTVHPATVIAELEAAGFEPLRRRFFEVDPYELDAERTVIFLNRRASVSDALDDSQWARFHPAAIAELAQFNDASRSYYRDCACRGERPLLYGYLPHVFYRGTLDTRRLRVFHV